MFNRFCLSTGLAILGLMATSLTALGATTNGTVTFQDDTSATAPVDPTSPNIPLTTTDPNNPATNNTGTLTLDVAPKTIDFGTVTTSNAAQNLHCNWQLQSISTSLGQTHHCQRLASQR
ncbi:WxL domain-containing protein [Lactiplantibacillus plantarum]|uniref:WxL domain-containing protein n=1 Tax=Lactiplantibacillus plantarum TaxID=1590 RepID=UPI003F52AB50